MSRLYTQTAVRKIQEIWPLLPAAMFLLGFLIIVLSYLVGLSFSHGPAAEMVFPSLESVREVAGMPEFGMALANTVLFVIVGTPLELIAGLVLALLFYRTFYGREVARSIMLIPLAIPALVTATLLFILFDFPGGHVNHLLMGNYSFFPAIADSPSNWRSVKVFALGVSLLGKIWRDMPISMLILLAGLNAIDPELFDAAKTMGAGYRRRVQLIIIPLIFPAISAVVLLRSLEMWKEFIFPFVLAGRHNLLGTLIESLYNNWGKSHEAAVVALILVACIVISSFVFMWIMELIRKHLLRC